MELLKNFKFLKANSLVESVISIAIISICILVAFLIYINVIRQNRSIAFCKAKHSVELLYNNAIADKNYDDEDYKYENYIIEKRVEISKQAHVARVDFKVIEKNKSYVIHKIIPLVSDE